MFGLVAASIQHLEICPRPIAIDDDQNEHHNEMYDHLTFYSALLRSLVDIPHTQLDRLQTLSISLGDDVLSSVLGLLLLSRI